MKLTLVPISLLLVVLLAVGGCSPKPVASLDDAAAKHAKSVVERGPVRVTAEVQPVSPRLSDTPTLTVTIDHEEGVTVEKPLFGTKIGRFNITDLRDPLPKTDKGRVIVQQVYTLEPTEVGRLKVDPIDVTYTDSRSKGDGQKHTIATEPLSIEITSLLGDKTPSLDGLRPSAAPIALQSGSSAWLWAIVAFVLAAIAATFWRKRRVQHAPTAAVKILTAEELANLELDKLVASGLAATDIKQFYIALTSIVRRFIERTKGVRAPEQTTEEFLREISRTGAFGEDVRLRLRDFLESADLVKFAAHRPNTDDVDESVRRARLFLGAKETQS